jgi:hypothetical protein
MNLRRICQAKTPRILAGIPVFFGRRCSDASMAAPRRTPTPRLLQARLSLVRGARIVVEVAVRLLVATGHRSSDGPAQSPRMARVPTATKGHVAVAEAVGLVRSGVARAVMAWRRSSICRCARKLLWEKVLRLASGIACAPRQRGVSRSPLYGDGKTDIVKSLQNVSRSRLYHGGSEVHGNSLAAIFQAASEMGSDCTWGEHAICGCAIPPYAAGTVAANWVK